MLEFLQGRKKAGERGGVAHRSRLTSDGNADRGKHKRGKPFLVPLPVGFTGGAPAALSHSECVINKPKMRVSQEKPSVQK